MIDWGDRLIIERNELSQKLFRLDSFIMSADFNDIHLHHRVLLSLQAKIMSLYLEILDCRIQLLELKGDA